MSLLKVAIDTKVFSNSGQTPEHVAIRDLKFSIEESEIVCVLGPSGCGKTTLLNIIAGLIEDFDGDVTFDPSARGRLTYVFQTPRLLPWRSVLDNIELARQAAGGSPDLSRQLIADVGLEKFTHAFPSQLSLGMQRRAALARAFACKPAVLLMDEPFVSLDEQTAEQLRDLLLKMWRSRTTTILFVTHDSREAIKLADRILILDSAPARVLHCFEVPIPRAERNDPVKLEMARSALPVGHMPRM